MNDRPGEVGLTGALGLITRHGRLEHSIFLFNFDTALIHKLGISHNVRSREQRSVVTVGRKALWADLYSD